MRTNSGAYTKSIATKDSGLWFPVARRMYLPKASWAKLITPKNRPFYSPSQKVWFSFTRRHSSESLLATLGYLYPSLSHHMTSAPHQCSSALASNRGHQPLHVFCRGSPSSQVWFSAPALQRTQDTHGGHSPGPRHLLGWWKSPIWMITACWKSSRLVARYHGSAIYQFYNLTNHG